MNINCNKLITYFYISDSIVNCNNYLYWKQYLYIDNTNLVQNNAYC